MPKPEKIAHFTVTALVVALVGTALCREIIVIANILPDNDTQNASDVSSSQNSADAPSVPPAY